MELLEAIRISPRIIDKVIEEDDSLQMGFECEFYTGGGSDGLNYIDLTDHTHWEDVEEYFYNTNIDEYAIAEWIIDNGKMDEALEIVAFDHEYEVNNIFDDWLSDHEDWYKKYLEERGQWDEENDEPVEEADDEVDAEGWLRHHELESGGLDDEHFNFAEKLEEAKEEAIRNPSSSEVNDLANMWFSENPVNFVEEMGWQPDDEWEWDEDGFGTLVKSGGTAGLQNVADSMENDDFPSPVVLDSYQGEKDGIDDWYVEPDSSLTSNNNGVEVSSAVYPLATSLEYMEKFFNWMWNEGVDTDSSTGLHVSLSFMEGKEPDEIDFLKLAILLGEKYLLEKFGRLGNEYTKEHLTNIVAKIKGGQWPKVKEWDEFKKLALELEQEIKDRQKTFNMTEFAKNGRVEFRIMGGSNYHHRWDEVREVIGRYVMLMKIAADPELFKREYMSKLIRLITTAAEDALDENDPHMFDPYGKVSEAKKNPLYKEAKIIFRGNKQALQYVLAFISHMEEDDQYIRRTTMDNLAQLAHQVRYMNRMHYMSLFESKGGETKINAATAFLRKLAKKYDITPEEFVNGYNPNLGYDYMNRISSAYVPIANDITGTNTNAALLPILFDDYDSTMKEWKKWFISHVQTFRKVPDTIRKLLFDAIHGNERGMVPNSPLEHKEIALKLMIAATHMAHQEGVDKEVWALMREILNMVNITQQDLERSHAQEDVLAQLGYIQKQGKPSTQSAEQKNKLAQLKQFIDNTAESLSLYIHPEKYTKMVMNLSNGIPEGMLMFGELLRKYRAAHRVNPNNPNAGHHPVEMNDPGYHALLYLANHFQIAQHINDPQTQTALKWLIGLTAYDAQRGYDPENLPQAG